MRVGDLYPRHRISALEAALARDDPELAQMFARWEVTERAAADEPSRYATRLHAVGATLSASIAAELIVVCLLSGFSTIAAILVAIATGLTSWHCTRGWHSRSVRREPRLRRTSPLAFSLRLGSVSRPR